MDETRATASPRFGRVERTTRETSVACTVGLDGTLPEGGETAIDVPDGFFGHMLEALSTHGGLALDLAARGDTHVDLHHTVEDVGIALGGAILEALDDRKGIYRFAHAYAPLDEALARAVVDLSGRGTFVWECPPAIETAWVTGTYPMTLTADFFQALADRGRLTLHLSVLAARNPHHAAEAAFKAAALALRQAVSRRPGPPRMPSTKGTLTA